MIQGVYETPLTLTQEQGERMVERIKLADANGDPLLLTGGLTYKPYQVSVVHRVVTKAQEMGWEGAEPKTADVWEVLADWLDDKGKPTMANVCRLEGELL